MVYAGLVLACQHSGLLLAISMLWQYELNEHNIILTPEAGREDSFLIIGAVTLLTVVFFICCWVVLCCSTEAFPDGYGSHFIRAWQIKNFDLNRQMSN